MKLFLSPNLRRLLEPLAIERDLTDRIIIEKFKAIIEDEVVRKKFYIQPSEIGIGGGLQIRFYP